jgi:hypothetical protein
LFKLDFINVEFDNASLSRQDLETRLDIFVSSYKHEHENYQTRGRLYQPPCDDEFDSEHEAISEDQGFRIIRKAYEGKDVKQGDRARLEAKVVFHKPLNDSNEKFRNLSVTISRRKENTYVPEVVYKKSYNPKPPL